MENERIQKIKILLKKKQIKVCGIFFIFVIILYFLFLSPPSDFPKNYIVTIKEGTISSDISSLLKSEHIIKYEFMNNIFVRLLGGHRKIVSGDYFFNKPENAFTIATRIIGGKFELEPIKITIPEGTSIREMSDILSKKLTNFNEQEFISYTQGKEGYLFPDTYFFFPNTKIEKIVSMMEDNFQKKIDSIKSEITASGKPLKDIVIMASIIEAEANTSESRAIVSGILWKRLNIGMPLQVDAAFEYINGKNTSELTKKDLTVNSPYNTYKNKGLPPTPINNPGIDSLLAAVKPTQTPYLYYLSDKNTKIHYAKTLEEHNQNIKDYLN
ncbi:MAG: endolytic transglycosylase MltG [Candidatus Paceibacterota bacterium]